MLTNAKRWFCVAIFGLAAFATSSAMAEDLPEGHPRLVDHGGAFSPRAFQIDIGAEQTAKTYYADVLSAQTGLATPATILTITVADLLAYLGYADITAVDLHAQSSTDLMARGTGDEILAIRFFAPKITSVSEKPVAIPDGGFGWRKVVRLISRPGSPARTNGIEAGYILQNIFSKSATDDPFDGDHVSVFNQAMLTRLPGSGPYSPAKRAAYFITFEPFVVIDPATKLPVKVDGAYQGDGRLSFKLGATFDEFDRDPETNLGASDYFVPDACENCHGGRTAIKINFLDTDHWFDRVFPNYGLAAPKFSEEDFTGMASSPFGLLYDGGTDLTTPQFKAAFDVIRKFNTGAVAQNTDAGSQPFQKLAAERWLQLHQPTASAEAHVPPIDRGFGTGTWSAATAGDKELVYYLNRYCYRCHSSVRYNVFDRDAVLGRAGGIPFRVLDINDAAFWMPQDRIFPGLGTKQGEPESSGSLLEFLTLLDAMQ
ncbi:MAG: hypothetical protein EOP22_08505 [Hyphomicrobiales bacterium]|nr:MAG: hypothetical protein EOP22_08505 [Hyphomicrobiales bacterium]